MSTFLLTWNHKRFGYEWPELPADAQKTKEGQLVSGTPRCSPGDDIQEGDRIFVVKRGDEPHGIFASGRALSAASAAPPGAKAPQVEVRFDRILDPAVEPLVAVSRLPTGVDCLTEKWSTAIEPAAAAELERLWQGHLTGER